MTLEFGKIASEVAKKESGKKQVNIAQINEVLKDTLEILAAADPDELQELLDKYR